MTLSSTNGARLASGTGLEMCLCFSATPLGRKRHAGREYLPRHCHREAFAAIVLGGGYVEAGDRGRLRVRPGDVVLHSGFESHLDQFAQTGADVLVLPFDVRARHDGLGRVADPDALMHLAERDVGEAARRLAQTIVFVDAGAADWPDRLARDLREDPDLGIEEWAECAGLCPESVSRGFRRAYGVAPVTFRARMRTLKALELLARGDALADIAAVCGFADQAHMTRSVRDATGYAPGALRALRPSRRQ